MKQHSSKNGSTLNNELKEEIQTAYRNFLAARELKPRYGQKLMIAEIARTLGEIQLNEEGIRTSGSHLCVVEAGTGTGKTVAYLLAALPVAKHLNKKVVLATATVALQEQVVFKDLPEILNHSGLNFTFSLAKGRGRYLCLTKLDRILSETDSDQFIPLYEDEMSELNEREIQLYKHMMSSLSNGSWDGDRDNWEDELDQPVWQRVTTDHRQCTGRRCSNVRNCSFFKAREQLDEADCIVANHDLVLADLALGGGAILPAPEETIYIFDEGHHLPEKALNHFACHTRYKSTVRWLGQSEGQWPGLIQPLRDATYFQQLAEPVEAVLKSARSIMETNLPMLQALVQSAVAEAENSRYSGSQSPRVRFPQGVAPKEMEHLAEQLREAFAEISLTLEKLHRELETLLEEDYPAVPKVDLENLFPLVGTWLVRAEANLALWDSYADTRVQPDWPVARWITVMEFNDIADYEIVSSPVLASRTLEEDLWSRCCGAVVTSATLTALNSFDRFQYRAGTYPDSRYLAVPSPFKFADNAVLEVPPEAIDASDARAHTENLIENLPRIIDKKAGTLVLFSSRRQMLDVHDELPHELRSIILVQGSETKQMLIKKHKKRVEEGMGSVIFGLASFAEGVDLPGDYCTHVIIAKIPFAVPDDPIEAALAEWIEAQGGNAFMQISVPDAAMRLVQACGRLLRTESDSGRVTIMDRRIVSKRYGQALLDSLPPFKRSLNR